MSARFFFSHASNVSVVVSLWSNAFGGIWLFLEKFALQCLPILGCLLRYIFFLFTLCLPLLYWFLSLIFIFIPEKISRAYCSNPCRFSFVFFNLSYYFPTPIIPRPFVISFLYIHFSVSLFSLNFLLVPIGSPLHSFLLMWTSLHLCSLLFPYSLAPLVLYWKIGKG